MNTKKVDQLINITDKYICVSSNKMLNEKGYIPDSMASAISSFGAAVAMGSLLSAVARFISKSDETRKIMDCMNRVLAEYHGEEQIPETLFKRVQLASDKRSVREEILDCAVAASLSLRCLRSRKKKRR